MPIGGRAPHVGEGGYPAWPANLRDTAGFPVEGGYGQVQDPSGFPGAITRHVTASTQPEDSAYGTIRVARLDRVPGGQEWVLERLVVYNQNAAPFVFVGTGDLTNVLDGGELTAGVSVMSDPQPIRLVAGDQLWVFWLHDVDGDVCKAQLRIESV